MGGYQRKRLLSSRAHNKTYRCETSIWRPFEPLKTLKERHREQLLLLKTT